jgi:4-hydroxy-tetrahydrodipicolinate synthase
MLKIRGTYTALVTPFKNDGSIDVDTLQNLVEWQIESGIHGLVPCGSTGEAATLSLDDYKIVVETVVDKTRGRVPVVAGATHNNTSVAIEHSKIANNAGVDALLHATPYYNKPTLSGLIAHYKAIAHAVDLPIVLYNVPGRTALNMSASSTLEIVKKVDSVIGIKEASGDIVQIMEIIKGSSSNFSVLSGDDAFAYPVIMLGGDGVICTASNEIPKEFAELSDAALVGDIEKAKKLHYEWIDLMTINFIESNPIPVKTALNLMGKIDLNFRLPLVAMTENNKSVLEKVLKEHKLI